MASFVHQHALEIVKNCVEELFTLVEHNIQIQFLELDCEDHYYTLI